MKQYFFVEMTDTFGGEPNYGWVHRFKVRAASPMGAIRKVSHETGMVGRMRKGADFGDIVEHRVAGAAIVFFTMQWHDNNPYENAKLL